MTRIISRKGAITMAVLCAFGSLLAQPACANSRDDHGRDEHHRNWRHREVRHREYGYDHRSYGGYPPPIVYAPPEPGIGIRLVIPLHFH